MLESVEKRYNGNDGDDVKMEKATIFDYARICKANNSCLYCPLGIVNTKENTQHCAEFISVHPDKANEIILSWCKEHPAQTRQDKFLKTFPNAEVRSDGVLDFPPCIIDKSKHIEADCLCSTAHGFNDCDECRKNYWLAEVEENE